MQATVNVDLKEVLAKLPRNDLRELLKDFNVDVRRGIAGRTDTYKLGGHWNMLPEGTTFLNSYFESRPGAQYSFTKFYGLQGIMKKFLTGQQVYEDEIEQLINITHNHLGDKTYFNEKGFRQILECYDGKLPISIQAVKEGTRVPVGNVMMQIINTDPRFPWLVNYLETILCHIWYTSVVATKSAIIVDAIMKAIEVSCDSPDEMKAFIVRLMLHDFGYRGATCEQAAGAGGLGHLTNSLGTDTVAAIFEAIDYYKADPNGKDIALSVIATEHSIETAEFGEYGPDEGDRRYLKRMLEKYPNGVLSIVCDGNSVEKFVKMVCEPEFVRLITERGIQDNGQLNRVVLRPDSPRFKGDTPEAQVEWIADELYAVYGGTINTKDRRVLNSAVGVIYGDGLSEFQIVDIYTRMMARYDVTSFVVGQGGGLLQKVNRDTQRSAFKCSAQYRNGKWHDVYKKPQDVSKASKRGRLALIINDDGEYETILEQDLGDRENQLIEVFRNGEILVEWTLDDLRADWK